MAPLQLLVFISTISCLLDLTEATCPSPCTCDFSRATPNITCCFTSSNQGSVPAIVLSVGVESADLTGLTLPLVNRTVFAGTLSKQLVFLTFKRNAVETVQPGTFDDMTQLEELDLSENRISHLPSGIFNNNPYLRSLNLQSNVLCGLTDTMLPPQPSLVYLNVAGNRLASWNISLCDHFNDSIDIIAHSNWLQDSVVLDLFCPLQNLDQVNVERNLNFDSNGMAEVEFRRTCPDTDYRYKDHTNINIKMQHNRLQNLTVGYLNSLKTCFSNLNNLYQGKLYHDLRSNCECEGNSNFALSLNYDLQIESDVVPSSGCVDVNSNDCMRHPPQKCSVSLPALKPAACHGSTSATTSGSSTSMTTASSVSSVTPPSVVPSASSTSQTVTQGTTPSPEDEGGIPISTIVIAVVATAGTISAVTAVAMIVWKCRQRRQPNTYEEPVNLPGPVQRPPLVPSQEKDEYDYIKHEALHPPAGDAARSANPRESRGHVGEEGGGYQVLRERERAKDPIYKDVRDSVMSGSSERASTQYVTTIP